MNYLFSKKQGEHAELWSVECKGEKRKKACETYEDNESSKQCIDYMYCRNFELNKKKWWWVPVLPTLKCVNDGLGRNALSVEDD